MLRKRMLALALGVLACASEQDSSENEPLPDGAVVSLMGDTLLPAPIPDAVLLSRQENLDAAQRAHDATPDDPDSIIWYGRRLAYIGRYQEAISVYTVGIEKHPNDARMYRHRGHRYITVRDLDAAVGDFENAVRLIQGEEDEVEPDGLPNALNIPTSTLQSNIWYHLGLARYLQGDFAAARDAYVNGTAVSNNDDMRVAMSYWHYMALARLGETEAAAGILATIQPEMDIIENHSYQRLLLLFKGSLPVDSVLDVASEDDVPLANATVSYGVGQWHALNGRPEDARAMWEGTLRGTQWAAFGYIAAEAELARGS